MAAAHVAVVPLTLGAPAVALAEFQQQIYALARQQAAEQITENRRRFAYRWN